jgi:hypothetical protein
MARRRKLVVVVRIDAPWPEGSADLNDAINRVLYTTLAKAEAYTVVAGFEPKATRTR